MLFVILKTEVTANQHRDEIVLAPRGFRAVLRPPAGPAAVPTVTAVPHWDLYCPMAPRPLCDPQTLLLGWSAPPVPATCPLGQSACYARGQPLPVLPVLPVLPDDGRLWSALRASPRRPARLLSTATGPRAIGPRADPTAATACPASPLCPAQSHRQPHLAAPTHERSGPDKCSESVTIMGFKKCVLLPQKTEN